MKEDSRKVLKSMMMVTQLGIVMMVPIFLCGALGVWLNRLTGIDIIFPKKKENEKLQYMEDLKNYRNTHPDEDFSDVMEGKKKRYPEHKTRQNF